MLPQKKRLPPSLFPNRPERQVFGRYLIAKISRAKEDSPRFAVILSRQAAKLATRRHQLKRIILAEAGRWPIIQKHILLVGRPGIDQASRASLKEDLLNIEKQIKS